MRVASQKGVISAVLFLYNGCGQTILLPDAPHILLRHDVVGPLAVLIWLAISYLFIYYMIRY